MEVDGHLSAQATDKLQDPIVAWLRKLDPSRALPEWIFKHCVSPLPSATATIGPCIRRKLPNAAIPPHSERQNERAWKDHWSAPTIRH